MDWCTLEFTLENRVEAGPGLKVKYSFPQFYYYYTNTPAPVEYNFNAINA